MKVLAGGRFNRVHPGHIYFFEESKKFGDELIIIVANDSHNTEHIEMEERKKNVEETMIPNKVRIGYPNDFIKIVEEEHPDVIALGYDQSLPKGVEKFLEDKKIKIVRIGKHGNYSSRTWKS